MRESCMYGSVRGALSNERPYRNRRDVITVIGGAASLRISAFYLVAVAGRHPCRHP
jgi:hypothetical protein